MKNILRIIITTLFFLSQLTIGSSAEFLKTNVLYENNDSIDLFIPEDEIESNVGAENSKFSEKTAFPDNNKTITLKSLKDSDTDFIDLFDKSSLRLSGDLPSYYYGIQGGCYDGHYYYFSVIVKGPDDNNVEKTVQKDTRVVCATQNADGSFTIVAMNSGLDEKLGHANDMTYNKNTKEVIFACCDPDGQKVCSIQAEYLRATPIEKEFSVHMLSCRITSIDYNETRNQYVVSIKDKKNCLFILDGNFNLIKGIGDSTHYDSDEKWVRQGIFCDNKYIYYSYFLRDGNEKTNTEQNKIRIFDWSGNYVKTLLLSIPTGNDRIYEIEHIIFTDEKVLLGFNCVISQQNRKFCYVDISDETFHIMYCPDENVDEHIASNDTNVTSIVFRGIPTELYKFRVFKKGYDFVGWTAYRVEVDKWYYVNASGNRGWYTEGNQPTGYEKYIYQDKAIVSQTGLPNESVLMCAQWEPTNKFHITFLPSGGTGSMSDLDVEHGKGANLTANAFTKTNREFLGWNAYWSELDKWYYQSPDGTSRGWYKEGFQHENWYKKYVYSDKHRVVETAYKGSHVYMYAVWDEYSVYYDANGENVKLNGVKEKQTAKYSSNARNPIYAYTSSDIISGKTFIGYNLYRADVDKWYYQSADGQTRAWYNEDNKPAGYTKYLKTFGNSNVAYLGGTALPGERLILVAQWSE